MRSIIFYSLITTEHTCARKPDFIRLRYPFQQRWYYNAKERRCTKIIGCEGKYKDSNNFDTETECMQTCRDFKGIKVFQQNLKIEIP